MTLCERFPVLDADTIIRNFVVPPRFIDSTFENYIPNEAEPSQFEAKIRIQEFADAIRAVKPKRFWKTPKVAKHIYLDGGFGVGKTHLLTALAHNFRDDSTYGSFVEYTNLVGALGFEKSVSVLSQYRLICIDEFELDDPGDTVLISTLLTRLSALGCLIATTSNTLPDRLGEGRFAADDFMREIQGLSASFDVIRIDGPDYRHRDEVSAGKPMSDEDLIQVSAAKGLRVDNFEELDRHLLHVHPSSYGAMVEDTPVVFISKLHTITNQNNALRWVALIDRLYDREIPIAYSGVNAEWLFSDEMRSGGYRKKYLRAISRLGALTREWWSIQDSNL